MGGPVFSVADAAGGEWPNRARVAAVALVALTRRGEGSMGIRLLTDIRSVFGARDVMRTKDLLNALIIWRNRFGLISGAIL
jgi:hypothetical protein